MKKPYIVLPFLVYLFSATACICTGDESGSPEPELGSGYLVFGHFYGECIGESCVEIFSLGPNTLREDTKDQYPTASTFYEGDFDVSLDDKYDLVKDLPSFFPPDLLEETETRIGQPDAGDWGGLYIEYNYNGKRRYWLVDKMKSNVPAYLHAFIDKVNEKISIIND